MHTYHRMRGIAKMRAVQVNDIAFLAIEDAHGNGVDLFMPTTLATALAEVFTAHQAGEAAALRARQMNAELPADQRDVLLAKGMVA
ncbi:hypothetical protein [Roseovarius mucosus]|uniref:hypothetical protein n=1 Tax=Roseovarius mucosus TaxID=215743 RepID=UPI0035CFFCE9